MARMSSGVAPCAASSGRDSSASTTGRCRASVSCAPAQNGQLGSLDVDFEEARCEPVRRHQGVDGGGGDVDGRARCACDGVVDERAERRVLLHSVDDLHRARAIILGCDAVEHGHALGEPVAGHVGDEPGVRRGRRLDAEHAPAGQCARHQDREEADVAADVDRVACRVKVRPAERGELRLVVALGDEALEQVRARVERERAAEALDPDDGVLCEEAAQPVEHRLLRGRVPALNGPPRRERRRRDGADGRHLEQAGEGRIGHREKRADAQRYPPPQATSARRAATMPVVACQLRRASKALRARRASAR